MGVVLDAYDTRARQDPAYLTEMVLQTIYPFKPINISYLIEENPRGKFFIIRMVFRENRLISTKIALGPWSATTHEELLMMLGVIFRSQWAEFYLEPEDHIELGME